MLPFFFINHLNEIEFDRFVPARFFWKAVAIHNNGIAQTIIEMDLTSSTKTQKVSWNCKLGKNKGRQKKENETIFFLRNLFLSQLSEYSTKLVNQAFLLWLLRTTWKISSFLLHFVDFVSRNWEEKGNNYRRWLSDWSGHRNWNWMEQFFFALYSFDWY